MKLRKTYQAAQGSKQCWRRKGQTPQPAFLLGAENYSWRAAGHCAKGYGADADYHLANRN